MHSRTLEKIQVSSIKILILVIPIIPLYVSFSFLYPWIEGKNYAFRILVELACVLWSGLVVLNKGFRPQNSLLLLTILVFTFIVGLADLFGVNPYKSFWSSYERMEGYITILHLAMYFVIVRSVFRTRKDWNILLIAFFAVSILVSSDALLDRFHERQQYFRVIGTIGNSAFLASYLLLSVFVGLILLVNAHKTSQRFWYLTGIWINIVGIYLTATRGAILALISGIAFFCLFYAYLKSDMPKEKLFKKIALVGAVSVAVCLIGVVLYLSVHSQKGINLYIPDDTVSRMSKMFSDRSYTSRIEAWKVAWEGVKENPVLGWGQENFDSVYVLRPSSYGETTVLSKPHNIVLEWIINAGILGLVSYLSIFAAAFYTVYTSSKKMTVPRLEMIIIATSLFVYFAQNLLIFDTISTYIVFFTLLAYINVLGNKPEAYDEQGSALPDKINFKSVAITILAFLMFLASSYFVNYRPMKESQAIHQILYELKYGRYRAVFDPDERVEFSFLPVLHDFKKALSHNTFGDAEVREIMTNIAFKAIKLELFDREGFLDYIQYTLEEIHKMVATDHYNIKKWNLMIDLYNAISEYDASFIAKKEIIIREYMRVSPDNQLAYVALVDNYILKKEYEKALSTLQNMVELDKQNDNLQLRYAQVGILVSRDDIVKDALEKINKIRSEKYDGIYEGRKYALADAELLYLAHQAFQMKNYIQALRFYKEVVAYSPEKAQYHSDIAKIYHNLGDKVNALREAEKAAELDPVKFADEPGKYIFK